MTAGLQRVIIGGLRGRDHVSFRLVACLVVAGGVVPSIAAAADNPNGFVRDRVTLNQTMADMLKGRFYEEVRCAENCLMATRLVISGQEAADLGFAGAKKGYWFEIGRLENVSLKGGVWTKVHLRLNAKAAARIRESKAGAHISGQVVASSKESGRHGWASWIRTCPWPRA
jgi:hypothetical protein